MLVLVTVGILTTMFSLRCSSGQISKKDDHHLSHTTWPDFVFIPSDLPSSKSYRGHLILDDAETFGTLGFKDSVVVERILLEAEHGWLNEEFTEHGVSIIDGWKEDRKYFESHFDEQLNLLEKREVDVSFDRIKARYFNQDTNVLVYHYKPSFGQLPGKTGVARGKMRYYCAMKITAGGQMNRKMLKGLDESSKVLRISARSNGIAILEELTYDSLNLRVYSKSGFLQYQQRLPKGTKVEEDRLIDLSFDDGFWIVRRCEMRYDGHVDLVCDRVSKEAKDQKRITVDREKRQFYFPYKKFGFFEYVKPDRWDQGVNMVEIQVYDSVSQLQVPRKFSLMDTEYGFYPLSIEPKPDNQWEMFFIGLFQDSIFFKGNAYGLSGSAKKSINVYRPRVKINQKTALIKECKELSYQKSTNASYCECVSNNKQRVTVSLIHGEYGNDQYSIQVFYVNERKFVYDGKHFYNVYEEIVAESKPNQIVEQVLIGLYFNNDGIVFSH